MCGQNQWQYILGMVAAMGTVGTTMSATHAQTTITFTGAVSEEWSEPGNWAPPIVPMNMPNTTVMLPANMTVRMDWDGLNEIGAIDMGIGSVVTMTEIYVVVASPRLVILGPSTLGGLLHTPCFPWDDGVEIRAEHPDNVLPGGFSIESECGKVIVRSNQVGTFPSPANWFLTESHLSQIILDTPFMNVPGVDFLATGHDETLVSSTFADVMGDVSLWASEGGSASLTGGDVFGSVLVKSTAFDEGGSSYATLGDIHGSLEVIASDGGSTGSSSSSAFAGHVLGEVKISGGDLSYPYADVATCASVDSYRARVKILEPTELGSVLLLGSELTLPSNTLVTVDTLSVRANPHTFYARDASVGVSYLSLLNGGQFIAPPNHDTLPVSAKTSARTIQVVAGDLLARADSIDGNRTVSFSSLQTLTLEPGASACFEVECSSKIAKVALGGLHSVELVGASSRCDFQLNQLSGTALIQLGSAVFTGLGTVGVDMTGAPLLRAVGFDVQCESEWDAGISATVQVQSTFRLAQSDESNFAFDGTLVFSGGSGMTLEAMGEDRGVPTGSPSPNFELGRLHVQSGTVHLVDDIDNENRLGQSAEALYLSGAAAGGDALTLGSGATLHLHTLSAYAFLDSVWVDLRELVPAGQMCVVFDSGQICVDEECYADCDGNGSLGILDYICFSKAFTAGDPYTDCDNSGSLNILDYICYGDAFAAGCP